MAGATAAFTVLPGDARQVFVPADRGRATTASLVQYDRLMADKGTIGNLLKLVDKNKLPTR